jgi:mxaC protein
VLALAGMQRKEQPMERISRGAEIVVLLDRSRSMDQTLASRGGHAWEGGGRERKGQVAQRLLGEFVAARPEDRFAVVLFSVKPLVVSGFTQEHDIVKAAIEASGSGRGLSDTDIGTSLETALRLFSNRAYVGPRVVLLVSDGGAHLTPEIRSTLTNLIRRERVSLYWIYLRSFGSRGLMANAELGEDQAESVPSISCTSSSSRRRCSIAPMRRKAPMPCNSPSRISGAWRTGRCDTWRCSRSSPSTGHCCGRRLLAQPWSC